MLPIHEQFYTFQGEGLHAGRAAFFIRTFGCPVHCPWCDSAGTWHPDYIPEKVVRWSAEDLVAEVPNKGRVCRGDRRGAGYSDLTALVEALHTRNLPVHLETSGAFPIRGDFDWITLSPKRWKLPLAENLRRADEFKIIVDQSEAIEEYNQLIGDRETPVWLHPEWSRRSDRLILDAITEWVKAKGAPFRAGWQLHKPYRSDTLDAASARPAPLGGDPKLGF